jgi:hypothetical protein
MPADRHIVIAAIAGLLFLTVLRAEDSGEIAASESEPVAVSEEVTPPKSGIPSAYPEERYLPVWKKSPFMREAAPAPEQARKSFSRDFFLSGYVESADETIAYLKNQKTGESIRLTTKGGNSDFRLLTLKKDRDPGKVFVTIEHGTEKADIGYDPAAFAQPASPGQGAPAGAPPAAANRVAHAGVPGSGAPAQTGEPTGDQPTGPYLNPAAERMRQQQLLQQQAQSSGATSLNEGGTAPQGRKRRILPEPLRIE